MKRTAPSRPGHIALGHMIGALLEGPQSVQDLVYASGLSATAVRQYMLAWRKQKVVRVGEWHADKRGRFTSPAYVFGSEKNAARPRPAIDAAARQRSYRLRRRANLPLLLLAA